MRVHTATHLPRTGAPAPEVRNASILAEIAKLPPSRQKPVAKRAASMPVSHRLRYVRACNSNRPTGAIRAFCRECMGWETGAVDECTSLACPLYSYRADAENGVDDA